MIAPDRRNVTLATALGVVVWALSGVSGAALASTTDSAAATDRGSAEKVRDLQQRMAAIDRGALRAAIEDLVGTFGSKYPDGSARLARLDDFDHRWAELERSVAAGDPAALAAAAEFVAFARAALMANPLLDDPSSPDGAVRLVVVRRKEDRLGLPQNWEGNASLPRTGYDNEIAVLSSLRGTSRRETSYAPDGGRFVGDVDLHFDATRLLFSMPSPQGPWRIYEREIAGGKMRELPLIDEADVDNYDACYLPSGEILFTSTAPFIGVPCVGGAAPVANLYLFDSREKVRRLTFEQDHDWCPTVLEDGRVLYQRWEYADLPHFASRLLFTMNPDGTRQRAFYGSNSYWPNALFYARPIPGHPSRFAAIVGGHHGVPRMGELVLFDTSRGRFEADGAVQRIPGRDKKVEPIFRDELVDGSWPKFLHPWPLSDKYFLVSMKPEPSAPWGIYLVDAFDNLTLLHAETGFAMFEPIPLRPRPTPPVLPNRVDPTNKESFVHIADIYAGKGLAGVPRGVVKSLRVVGYEFAFRGMGGQVNRVGFDGPWDVKRVLGTAPVESDGSAYFRIPANSPVSLQPLDGDGQALQLMRSWLTAMPGETVSCVGCHDAESRTSSPAVGLALRREPSSLTPWLGPPRGFSFEREVQPVLDRHCVRCHDGGQQRTDHRDLAFGPLDLRRRPSVPLGARDPAYNTGTLFPPAYLQLRQFVRAATIESDLHLLTPGEFHAETTRLVRLLRKGHHGVDLDAADWSRIVTWIDLNTPAHGTWQEIVGETRAFPQRDRRRVMDERYAGYTEAPEYVPTIGELPEAVRPGNPADVPDAANSAAGKSIGEAASPPPATSPAKHVLVRRTVDLGGGMTLELSKAPAGRFVLGDSTGHSDEQPAVDIEIERGFWIGTYEVTNEQFARFDPEHDSRLEVGDFLHFNERERGDRVDMPKQPVCRVSWREAKAFCRWLSERTGQTFDLPSEAEWEYACRAGSRTAMSYGSVETDFARLANLADKRLRQIETFTWNLPSGAIPPWRPAVERVDDGYRVSAPVGSYAPNVWGIFDMHGNVAEWTNSTFRANPPGPTDARENEADDSRKVVRGGSWYDRPQDARASYRGQYPQWQRVFDVGFRVVQPEPPPR